MVKNADHPAIIKWVCLTM